jgi:hypothetical protein
MTIVVNLDRVGSASFCRIQIGIQVMLIRIRLIRIDSSSSNCKVNKLNFFPENFNMSKTLQIVAHLTLKRKLKHAVYKSNKIF